MSGEYCYQGGLVKKRKNSTCNVLQIPIETEQFQNFVLQVFIFQHRFLHLVLQCFESWKVMQVDVGLFDLFPQFFNGVVVRRVTGKLINSETLFAGLEKLSGLFADLIFRPVLDQNDVAFIFGENAFDKLNI